MRSLRTAALAALTMVLLAGCTKFVDRIPEGGACTTTPECKAGLFCTNLICQRPVADIPQQDVPDVPDVPPVDLPDAPDAPDVEDTGDAEDAVDAVDVDVALDADVPDVRPDVPPDVLPDVVPDVTPDEGLVAEDALDVPEITEEVYENPIGRPCKTDGDCDGGTCVPLAPGTGSNEKMICTGPCGAGQPCPEGLVCLPTAKEGAGYVHACMPFPRGLCKPCLTADDCGLKNSQCVPMVGGTFCGAPCQTGACPDGFRCVDIDIPGVPEEAKKQCVPQVGTCACNETTDGQIFTCVVESGGDRCYGEMTCAKDIGWGICPAFLPEPELCDGKDNNCNSLTDEAFSIVDFDGKTKKIGDFCGTGACSGGVVICATKTKAVCSSEKFKIPNEMCGDGIDNDCNGLTDEKNGETGGPCTSDDIDGDGEPNDTDCAASDPARHHPIPGLPPVVEPCCPRSVPEPRRIAECDYDCNLEVTLCAEDDADSDGYPASADCNDADPRVHPGAPEVCDDTIDQDCNGSDLHCCAPVNKDDCNTLADPSCVGPIDCDGDGYVDPDDCNDNSPAVHPYAQELCNYTDDDCDGVIDNGTPGTFEHPGDSPCGIDKGECKPGRWVCTHYPPSSVKMECFGAINATPETCDGKDNDCNGFTDDGEAFALKGQVCDGDDLDQCKNGIWTCKPDRTGLECINETIHDLADQCDGKDIDCDQKVDTNCFPDDVDGDGFPVDGPKPDCDDTRAEVHPGAKEPCCNPALTGEVAIRTCDWNCDGQITSCDPNDTDGDGYIAKSAGGDDCDDTNKWIHPGAAEKCGDGVDQNCDGNDSPCTGVDADGDGYSPPADCNDQNKLIYPGAPELCNRKDDNCDGLTDEGNPEGDDTPCGEAKGACRPGHNVCVHYQFLAKVTCVPEIGPSPEKCNGVDDNCNGTSDEWWPNLGQACDGPDSDLCANGTITCTADGSGTACSAELVENIVESCNGVDDDCDGLTDEGFNYVDPKLGTTVAIGQACWGIGECGTVKMGVVECSKVSKRATCSTNADGSDPQSIPETCNGRDDDCDGRTDNGQLYQNTPVGGICLGIGTCGVGRVECNAAGTATCSTNNDGSNPGKRPELCDGLDNDCDGHTDEDVKPTMYDCRYKGVCTGFTIAARCMRGGWVCDYSGIPDFEGTSELSCDGLDNDCDGQTDEEFGVGKSCDGPDPDLCANGTWTCTGDKKGVECVNETVNTIDEQCNGIDDDCDGLTDEDFTYNGANVGQSCTGLGECGAIQGVVECIAPDKADCSTNPAGSNSQATGERCNGKDDDCDGKTDNGFAVGQACDGPDPDNCATGHYTCNTTGTDVECLDDTGTGTAEVCDYQDNNCDGKTDEGFFYVDPATLGHVAVGTACTGIGECGKVAGTVVCARPDLAACSTNPDGTNPQVKAELCNGLDDDCDGKTDEDLAWNGIPLGGDCTGIGQCGLATGKVVCSPTELVATCSTMPNGTEPKSTSELCDTVDNDCNGVTDDIPVPDKSSCRLTGVCTTENVQAFCTEGRWVCDYSLVADYQAGIETLCDYKDNNCDGSTDELYPVGQACDSDDSDQCKNGTFTCKASLDAVECINESVLSIKEKCGDAVDNDCNGLTDEENASGCIIYYKDMDQDNKGLPGIKKCLCKKGDVPFYTAPVGNDCDDTNPNVYPGHAELCNGIDDNCNKTIDENFLDKGKACAGPDGLCKNGTYVCSLDGLSLVCEGYHQSPEVCNGQDDDCNGLTDEIFAVGQACDGSDSDFCKNGTYTCMADGTGVECVNETVQNITETCNGKDDDCDGTTDEEWPVAQACDGPDTDLCKNGTWTCKADGSGVECVNEKLTNLTETCDNVDNDCNGSTDEKWPLKGKKCDPNPTGLPAGVPACATGFNACKADHTDIQCVNHVDCVYGSYCQSSGSDNVRDECLCGTGAAAVTCTADIANNCTVAGDCKCGSEAACTRGNTCQSNVCKCGTGAKCIAPLSCINGSCV